MQIRTRTLVLAMLSWAGVASLGFPAPPLTESVDLSALAADQRVFNLSPADFAREYFAAGFKWNSQAKLSARMAQKGSKVFGLPVVEAVVLFKGNHVKEMSFAIYTRGDVGKLALEDFNQILATAKSNLNRRTEFKPKETRTGSEEHTSFLWQHQNLVYVLESATTISKLKSKEPQPEFILLKVYRYEKENSVIDYGRSKRLIAPKTIKNNVKTKEDGDVVIEGIPMIDQGSKGYCACATTARVLSYYGRNVDQYELAQLMQTSNLGTKPDDLRRALKSLQTDMNFRVKSVYQRRENDHVRLLKTYERERLKSGAPPAAPIVYVEPLVNPAMAYKQMQPDILVAAVLRRKASVTGFLKDVRANVDEGMPLLWTVVLGVVKEEGAKQLSGGHMRLIIGYNSRTNEIIYSDTWGPGHENKRMPAAAAFGITMGLDAIRAY